VAGNFKSDDSFLRKLVIGAAGTNETIDRLKELGFNPIDLERGSTGFKIWKKIRIKRVSPVHFICVKDLRQAFSDKLVSITKPKGVEEGSEIRVVWTCAVAKQRSQVSEVSEKRLQLEPTVSARRQTIRLSRKKGTIILSPQVRLNEYVEENQIVAAVTPTHLSLSCPHHVDENSFIAKLGGVNLSERYAAAKALRYRGYINAQKALEERVHDSQEDIYVPA